MKFPIKDFFRKCDQIRSFVRIWSHLLKNFLMEKKKQGFTLFAENSNSEKVTNAVKI